MTTLSIIIPVFNEAHILHKNLSILHDQLKKLNIDKHCEVILVDGGSADATVEVASKFNNVVVQSLLKGRAVQMNKGAKIAQGRVLLFLHSDTRLPCEFFPYLSAIKEYDWGFFMLKLSGKACAFRVIERCINFRSSLTSVATGDQSIFIGRKLFRDIGGFADIPLMEDVEITKRLRRVSPPVVILKQLVTSSRRWEQQGVFSTILLMWRLRLYYFLGVSPKALAKQYYRGAPNKS